MFSRERLTKALISLLRCAGRYVPLLIAHRNNMISHDMANLIWSVIIFTSILSLFSLKVLLVSLPLFTFLHLWLTIQKHQNNVVITTWKVDKTWYLLVYAQIPGQDTSGPLKTAWPRIGTYKDESYPYRITKSECNVNFIHIDIIFYPHYMICLHSPFLSNNLFFFSYLIDVWVSDGELKSELQALIKTSNLSQSRSKSVRK